MRSSDTNGRNELHFHYALNAAAFALVVSFFLTLYVARPLQLSLHVELQKMSHPSCSILHNLSNSIVYAGL